MQLTEKTEVTVSIPLDLGGIHLKAWFVTSGIQNDRIAALAELDLKQHKLNLFHFEMNYYFFKKEIVPLIFRI